MGQKGQAENLHAKSSRNKGRPLREGGQQHQRGEHEKESGEKQHARNQLQGVSLKVHLTKDNECISIQQYRVEATLLI
jgi:hypothetical protein